MNFFIFHCWELGVSRLTAGGRKPDIISEEEVQCYDMLSQSSSEASN